MRWRPAPGSLGGTAVVVALALATLAAASADRGAVGFAGGSSWVQRRRRRRARISGRQAGDVPRGTRSGAWRRRAKRQHPAGQQGTCVRKAQWCEQDSVAGGANAGANAVHSVPSIGKCPLGVKI